MNRTRKGLIAASLLAVSVCAISLVPTALKATGMWSTLPVIGGTSYCASNVTGVVLPSTQGPYGQVPGSTQGSGQGICAQTVPAGPAYTGEETIPVDTPSGVTSVLPSALAGSINLKTNRLIGGDFGTNLWQRAAAGYAAISPTAAVMTADRWWAYSANNVMTITKQTGAADTIPALGLYASMRVARPSGTPSGASCVGQTLDKQAAAPLIGNNAIFSFYSFAPATFSASNSQVVVTVAYFTAADAAATQATIGYAGGNSSTFALGTTTGYTAAVAGVSPGTTGTVASGAATIPLSTTWTRYSVYAPIPATNASGTAVTAVGVQICATPTLTTTVSTDYFEFTGAQLQAMPSTATNLLPNGVISPTGFERRPAAVEQLLQQYYSYVLTESATQIVNYAPCAASTTSISNCLITYPVPMRLAPVAKYTAGFETCTTVACSAAVVCTANATASTIAWVISNTQNVVTCTSSAGGPAAGAAGFLFAIGTSSATGVMQFSAEP
jgi:hypothetical protein